MIPQGPFPIQKSFQTKAGVEQEARELFLHAPNAFSEHEHLFQFTYFEYDFIQGIKLRQHAWEACLQKNHMCYQQLECV